MELKSISYTIRDMGILMISNSYKENVRMTGEIRFEKIWEDGDLIELLVQVNSEYVAVKHRYYTSKVDLIELYEQLSAFLCGENCGFTWKSGDDGVGLCPSFVMTFSYADQKGHVKIEICMAIDDDCSFGRNHKCTFCVYSEIGLMDMFLKKIYSIIHY